LSDLDVLVQDALEEQVPLRGDARPDWWDVLRRADVVERASDGIGTARRPSRRGPRRLLVAAALVAVVGGAAAATPLGPALAGLGRTAFDGVSSWVRGDPGSPAPAAEQAGFAARNAASYAAFPAGTRLRLLLRETVGGKTLSLLGFRSGSSLCLRLVRADLAAGHGANQCVTLRELRRSAAPALVVAEAWFRIGHPETTVEGVFGFADDTVAAVEMRRTRSGWKTTAVSSNVFLALRARPSGNAKNPRPFDPIVQVRAIRRGGGSVHVPFVAGDSGDYADGVPDEPSYLRWERVRPEDLPGPAKVAVPFPGGEIGWLERREPRGEAFAPDRRLVERMGAVVFARQIQPDPESPLRVGVWLLRIAAGSPFATGREGEVMVCESTIEPLGRPRGVNCLSPEESGAFGAGRPFTLGYMSPEQITRFTGLAADAVARMDLFLASGRVVPAALRDNAYAVAAPTTQFPAKLVAYDSDGRAIGIQVFPASPKPAPCPTPSFASAPPAPEPYERLDLGSGHVNGHPIFGRSPAEIRAALGPPDRVAYFSSSKVREPTFFYGGTRPANVALTVRFGYRQRRLRAISLSYQSPSVVDRRLGHVLRLEPATLERRISSTYSSRYDLTVGYGAQPSRGCIGVFRNERRTVELTLGIDPHRPSRPFLVLSHGY
jgi:hypothetical protein